MLASIIHVVHFLTFTASKIRLHNVDEDLICAPWTTDILYVISSEGSGSKN